MKKIFLSVLLLALFILNSCEYHNYTYLSSAISNPELKKRGDLKVEASLSPRSVNGELAYSPINHVGVTAQYTGGIGQNAHVFEGALGYYMKKNQYLLSIYGGVGTGSLVNNGGYKELLGHDTWEWDHNSSYNKVFGQASLGRDLGKICHVSIGVRLSQATFDSYAYRYKHIRLELNDHNNSRGTTMTHAEYDTLQISRPARVLIVDPYVAATFFHKKRFSLTLQANFSLVKSYDELAVDHSIDLTGTPVPSSPGSTISQAPRRNQPLFFPVSISVGARFNISRKSKE